jgi:uncharacterized membrane-anchored protein YhcB (DUF1043 family)
MYIHIAWLYAAILLGCLIGLLIAGLCAAAKRGDQELEGDKHDTKQ